MNIQDVSDRISALRRSYVLHLIGLNHSTADWSGRLLCQQVCSLLGRFDDVDRSDWRTASPRSFLSPLDVNTRQEFVYALRRKEQNSAAEIALVDELREFLSRYLDGSAEVTS